VSERQLPWRVRAPNSDHATHHVVDDEGYLVALCFGDDDGHDEAVAIATLANRTGDPICADCGEPAACFGSYETEFHPAYACDECCAHGNEDGHCEPVAGEEDES
jgi:hypothetical protein